MKNSNLIVVLLFLIASLNYSYSYEKPVDWDSNGYLDISEFEHLMWITENPNSWNLKYEIVNDIDATESKNINLGDHDDKSSTPDEFMGWKPIGNELLPFTGIFEGNNYSIKNLYMNRKFAGKQDYRSGALFSVVKSYKSEIRNLSLENADFNLIGNGSFLVADLAQGAVINCHVIGGRIIGDIIGGLVVLNRGIIFNCSVSSTLVSFTFASGIAHGNAGVISCCYTESHIIGRRTVIGFSFESYHGLIFNSYAKNKLEIRDPLEKGGIFGFTFHYNSEEGMILNCFAANEFIGEADYYGFSGAETGSGNLWDKEICNKENVYGEFGYSTENMKNKDTYIEMNWNFEDFWSVDNDYPTLNINRTNEPKDTDGDGYYNIRSVKELRWLNESHRFLHSDIEFDIDINASESKNWFSGRGFFSIGYDFLPFYGNIKGNGHIIDSLFIMEDFFYHIGFIGKSRCDSCIIENIHLRNAQIETTGALGVLVCDSYSDISNCTVSGRIELKEDDEFSTHIGGLVMYNRGFITNCKSSMDIINNVSKKSFIGGITSFNNNRIENTEFNGNINSISKYIGGISARNASTGLIKKCKSFGTIKSSTGTVGGFVGENDGEILFSESNVNIECDSNYAGGFSGRNDGKILYCFSHGNVKSKGSIVGGFVGENYGMIKSSYSVGEVEGIKKVGGFCGAIRNTGFDELESASISCFWNIETSKIDSSIQGYGLTTEELMDKSKLVDYGWNFDFMWKIEESYPFVEINFDYQPTDTDGNGIINISNLYDIKWLSESTYGLRDDYELDNDINASSTRDYRGGRGLYPIGLFYEQFKGSFNGNGYIIDSLYFNRNNEKANFNPSHEYFFTALFGRIDSAEIRNLGITNCIINDEDKNSFSAALIGSCGQSKIINCFSNGSVQGYYASGLIANNFRSTVEKCFSECGVISYESYCGGLIARSYGSRISNSYSIGKVTGKNYVGGLLGYMQYGVMTNSYSNGLVTANGDYVGGLIGRQNDVNINSCYWDIETSQQNYSAEGIGITSDKMKDINTFLDAEWDFTDIWEINSKFNKGYPYFKEREKYVKVNNEQISINKLIVSPNPAYNKIIFNDDLNSKLSIRIFDLLGNLNFQTDTSTNTTIDLPNLPNGIYLIEINHNRKIEVQKLIINRGN